MQEAIWDETSAKWKLKVLQNGQVKEDEADFLINGAGFLKYVLHRPGRHASTNHSQFESKWKWPDIKGLNDFKGKLVHTARWSVSPTRGVCTLS